MTNERTFCPYCGTANLVNKQVRFIEGGVVVFQCHLCKRAFTDLSITNEEIEKLQTLKNV